MPARKPAGLIERHETAAEAAQRAGRESAMRPKRALPMEAPAELAARPVAAAAWRRVMRLYAELEAEIVTGLDRDHLIAYCILFEECIQLDGMRGSALELANALQKKYEGLIDAGELEEALALTNKVLGAQEAVSKIDARKDRKMDLLKRWRESLYLTPRARAGTAPVARPKEEPDELALLMDQFVGAAAQKRGGEND